MRLATRAEIRALEHTVINDWGIPEAALMQRAGEATWQRLLARWPNVERVRVFAGAGNNGGDGWVVAQLAMAAGYDTQVIAEPDREPATAVARRARDAYCQAGGTVTGALMQQRGAGGRRTVIVDALLGIGLDAAPRGWTADSIAAINASGDPVLSLDCPSGLLVDTGTCPGGVVCATATITFITGKRGLFTGRARDVTGEIDLALLDLPDQAVADHANSAALLDLEDTLAQLPVRRPTSHKGLTGHLLVVGGDHGMGGAALMAAEAGLRAGAGKVTLATRQEHVAAALSRRPELMVSGIDDPSELLPLIERATAVVFGPGMGTGLWGRDLMTQLATIQQPLLLDADALNLLAGGNTRLSHTTVITPHPGEAARLLDCDTSAVEQNRFAAVTGLADRYNVTAVLKGAGTLIAEPAAESPIGICPYGNPGMASGGMGDVLSGVVGSLLAQGLSAAMAAQVGVVIHSKAADIAAEHGGFYGLLAGDLLPPLQQLINSANASRQS